jgi:hypothetical protein
MLTTRRRFLSLLGLGAAAAGVELIAPEPARRIWQVSRSAPVPALAERDHLYAFTEKGLSGIDAGSYGQWTAATISSQEPLTWERLQEGFAEYERRWGAKRIGSYDLRFGNEPEPVFTVTLYPLVPSCSVLFTGILDPDKG